MLGAQRSQVLDGAASRDASPAAPVCDLHRKSIENDGSPAHKTISVRDYSGSPRSVRNEGHVYVTPSRKRKIMKENEKDDVDVPCYYMTGSPTLRNSPRSWYTKKPSSLWLYEADRHRIKNQNKGQDKVAKIFEALADWRSSSFLEKVHKHGIQDNSSREGRKLNLAEFFCKFRIDQS